MLIGATKKFWILDPIYAALGSLLAFFYALVPSYGFSIIMLTMAVSILRMPLVAKQVKSQQAMQRIQPELKRIQAKYKADPQKRNEELMKLYKEHGVNPFAGCLPLVLQMPLFIVLYRIIMNLSAIPPKHIPVGSEMYKALVKSGGKLQSFGLDLAQKASKVSGSSKVPYLLLVAMVVGTGLFQARQMSARLPKEAQNSQMAVMGKIMPAFLGLISYSIPAGVVLYFIVSNLWQIGQQYFLFRHQTPGGGPGAPPSGKGKGAGGAKDDRDAAGKASAGDAGDAIEPAASKVARPAKKGLLARLAEAANQTPADRTAPRKPMGRNTPPANGRAAKRTAGDPGGKRSTSGRGGASAPSAGAKSSNSKASPNGRPPRPSGRAQPPKGQADPKSRNNRKGK
jgi:YidC/Oxa1 family membrane protein insertase